MAIVAGTLSSIIRFPLTGLMPRVRFVLNRPSIRSPLLVVTRPETVTPDDGGVFYADLVPTVGMTTDDGSDAHYRVEVETIDGTWADFPHFKLFVPVEGGEFADLVSAPWNSGQVWVDSTPPSNQSALWLDTTIGMIKKWDSMTWIDLIDLSSDTPGAQGLPGPGAVPADTAVAAYLGSASSTRTAADARYLNLGSKKIVTFAGDSLTAFGGMDADDSPVDGGGFMPWATMMADYRFKPVQKGVGGDTTSLLLGRIANVIATKADVYHVLIGTNDAGALVPLATTIANYEALLSALRETKRPVVIGTLPPRGTWPAGVRAKHNAINSYIRSISYPNVHVVDYEAAFIDPATGDAQAGNLWDGLHTTYLGAFKLGKVLAPVLKKLIAQASPLPSNNAATVWPDARFVSRAAGDLPSGWGVNAGSGYITNSSVARTDQTGAWWQIVKTGQPDFTSISRDVPIGTLGLAVGDSFRGAIEFDFQGLAEGSSGGSSGLSSYILGSDGGLIAERSFLNTLLYQFTPSGSYSGVIVTPAVQITAETTHVRLAVLLVQNGTYRYDKATIFKV